jgi:hypothetical protein
MHFMKYLKLKNILVFALGMLTFALAALIVNIFWLTARPEKSGIVEDWEQICLWQDVAGIYLMVSPRGCHSTTCTQIKQRTGTAVLDLQNQEIQLDARFVLLETSRFPLPCTENCSGGGRVHFKFDQLIPNDYTLWFSEQKVGEVHIFSGRTTPRQCFENQPE